MLLKNDVAILPSAKATEQKGYFFKSVVPASDANRARLKECTRCFERKDREGVTNNLLVHKTNECK